MNLRQRIKLDFNIDLNIGDGSLTSSDPMELLDSDPSAAAHTEVTFIKVLHQVKRVLWKTKSRELVVKNGKELLQTKMDTIHFTDTQVIREVLNFYFDPRSKEIVSTPLVSDSPVKLPFTIGWLHFDSKIENGGGLGTSYFYSNPYMKLALYVYDLGFNDLSDGVSDTLRVHFQNSISEVQTVAPELKLNGTPQSDNETLFQAFTSDDQESYLLLGAVSGNFVKARITYQYMPELQDLAADTINQFRQIIHEALA